MRAQFGAMAWLMLISALCAPAGGQTVSIVTDENPSPAVRHGETKLRAALHEKGIEADQAATPEAAAGASLIITGVIGSNGPAEQLLKAAGHALPEPPEGLTVWQAQVAGKSAWVLAGSDDRGLMYAELDAADRIAWSTDRAAPFTNLRETTEHADVRDRAVSMYTMNRAYWESRFYDEAYWTKYLDTLAANRFNHLVIIFGYENGGFLAPCYPYFFDTEGFDDVRMVGITPEQQEKNLKALNRLIQMSHDRGLKVTLGIWDHIYRFSVQAGGTPGFPDTTRHPTPGLVWGMTDQNVLPYTKAALAKFLKAVPGIDGIQFRMHDESGLRPAEQPGFWHEIFALMKTQAPQIKIDLRIKGLQDSVIQNAVDDGLNFRLNTKYWMEQMGLPFHPTHVNSQDQSNRRHGYADLLRYPQQYQFNWQLWNGGTARILLFGDPDYARRFVESTHLYNGDGFEMHEPLATKMEAQPHDANPFDLLAPQYRYYDYEFERYWHLFQVFGRLGYNPATPAEVWDHEFTRRFGAAAPHIESALHRASWILPRIVTSDYPYSAFPTTVGWAERQCFGDLPTFAKNQGSDVAQFENFDDEARRLIEHGETAMIRPQENARWFANAAVDITNEIDKANGTIGDRRGKESDSTIVDLKILAHLAEFHARRAPAAVSYRLYARTKDPHALDDAIENEAKAIDAWRQIVAAAGDVYAPDIMMGLRSRSLSGHWKDELPRLEKGLAALKEQRQASATQPATQPAPSNGFADAAHERPVVTFEPLTAAPAGKPITLSADAHAASGIKWLRLRYRSVNQYLDYATLPMRLNSAGKYEATVPADQIPPKWDFMYFFEVMDNQGNGAIWPDLNQTTPYVVVHLQR